MSKIKVKSMRVLLAQAAEAGVSVDRYNYVAKGHDYIAFGIADPKKVRPDGSPFVPVGTNALGGYVLFSNWTGEFFGHTDMGVAFNSTTQRFDGSPWFEQLLSFFYYRD